MLSFQAHGALILSLFFVSACGGSSPSGALSTGSDSGAGGGDANANDGSASTQDTGTATDGPSSTQDSGNPNDAPSAQDSGQANDSAPATQDAGDAANDAPAAPCPNVRGAYAITAVDATGCGTSLSTSAPECIRQTACGITLQSMVTGGANRAVNGDAALQNNGSFSGAALMEGTVSRTGCTGTWNAVNSTMTVDCGGTGSSQACVLALRRTNSACN